MNEAAASSIVASPSVVAAASLTADQTGCVGNNGGGNNGGDCNGGGGDLNLNDFTIYSIGERDAMSVNMRNAGLGQLNEKYTAHLRNTMRREVSLINVDQRSLLNRFNNYSMTIVSDSLAPVGRDRRSYLDYLKAGGKKADGSAPFALARSASQDPLTRTRTFIESQRVTADAASRTEGVSLERLKLLTRPSRPYQNTCPRLKAAPVHQVHPEFAPSMRRARVKTAPHPSYLLRLHYQRIEQQRQLESLPNERRAHSTLGFSAHDATMRQHVLGDSRFVQLKATLVAPSKEQVPSSAALEQEEL